MHELKKKDRIQTYACWTQNLSSFHSGGNPAIEKKPHTKWRESIHFCQDYSASCCLNPKYSRQENKPFKNRICHCLSKTKLCDHKRYNFLHN